jgi:hypothetical protein
MEAVRRPDAGPHWDVRKVKAAADLPALFSVRTDSSRPHMLYQSGRTISALDMQTGTVRWLFVRDGPPPRVLTAV